MKPESVKCNLCGHDDGEILFRQHDLLTKETTQFAVVRCKHCGLVYTNPRPSSADIHLFYPREFVSYQFKLYSKQASIRERLVSLVTESSALGKVKVVARLVKPDPTLKVLDIGCGSGGFLHYLRMRLKCDVAGVDFDQESVKYCREVLGLDVTHGTVNILSQHTSRYDVMTMWHFLEHESDPLSALCTANRYLIDGGLLILEVPNVESLENKIFKTTSYLYDLPRHLYHFSLGTIGALLEKAGFAIQSISFPCFAGGFIGSVQNALFDGRVYKKLKENIFLFLALALILFPIDYVLTKTRRGSIMTVVAKKVRNS